MDVIEKFKSLGSVNITYSEWWDISSEHVDEAAALLFLIFPEAVQFESAIYRDQRDAEDFVNSLLWRVNSPDCKLDLRRLKRYVYTQTTT